MPAAAVLSQNVIQIRQLKIFIRRLKNKITFKEIRKKHSKKDIDILVL